MARQEKTDVADDQWHFEQDTLTESIEKEKLSTVEYPGEVVRTSSREELMECIKRGQRPTWVPTSGFQALREEEEARNSQRNSRLTEATGGGSGPEVLRTRAADRDDAADGKTLLETPVDPCERPRSALHRGDFSEDDSSMGSDFWTNPEYQPGLAITTLDERSPQPAVSYSNSSRPNSFDALSHGQTVSQINTSFISRRRAPSLGTSLSSSFMFRAPTSPLVQATSHRDILASEGRASQDISQRDKTRRRTMPPSSFHVFSTVPLDTTPPNFSRPFAPELRREASMPTSMHRTRLSMSSFTYHPRSSPQTPMSRSRRPSVVSEGGSRRRSSMVGSFEESILRGRMSTPPSKPLDFVAQIGVMGRGDCPNSLKCPAHVHVPFPAVFYSYPASASTRSVSDDAPSPYVGTIDLDHKLKTIILATKSDKRDAGSRQVHNRPSEISYEQPSRDAEHNVSKIHVGGAYRLPQQGQLQIVIKNPNKTAVKLFLVPYDLTGMEAGTKTFVRQRSFSTGSIIEEALSDKSSQTSAVDPLENKHILRYLIHLRFCCPAKNRFYLYDNVRVVFANRVPDGKEKLRNELQVPEPKFSAWKATKQDSLPKVPKSAPSTPTVSTFECESAQFFGDMDGLPQLLSPVSSSLSEQPQASSPPFMFPTITPPTKSAAWLHGTAKNADRTMPFDFADIRQTSRVPNDTPRPDRTFSPVTGFTTPLRSSPIPWRHASSGGTPNRSFSPVPSETRSGLLSKQFKELNEQSAFATESTSEEL